ncbi:MAG: hypothetical protein L6R36_004715 [Xanthoria steineri]|nr:MAG: hypothetical protein L6R36_004715 [Xanthoria steineri]
MGEAAPSLALKESKWNKAAANVQLLDDPSAKKQAQHQLQYIHRIPKAALASILSSWLYFGYAFKCLLDAQAAGLSGTPLKVAWWSYALHLGQAIPAGTPHLLALSAMGKGRQHPLLRLNGQATPSVDIFITYCGEEMDVLMDTVRATIAIDYPPDSYRVIVLDDSVSVEVETELRKLKTGHGQIYYSTRGTKPKTHTKAGNLNHGLKYVSGLPGGASDLVAVLDVDMIPSPHWLRALVPHLLVDSKVALANPPQRQYNIPDGDPLGQSMDILFDVMEPSKNATNSAWCCGTGFVVRRDALDGIGGIPEESINEDILTSFFLKAAGWEIVYVHEDVQWGLVPSSISTHLKQQKRTSAGIVSTAAALLNPRAQTMTPEEKYGAIFPAFAITISVAINMAALIVLPLLLLSGAPLVAYYTNSQLRAMSVLFLIKFLAIFSYDYLATQAANFHLNLLGIVVCWTIPFQFMTLARFALSIVTGGGVPLFTPSGLNVDVRAAKTFAGRMKAALWDHGFVVHVAVIASLISGVIASLVAAYRSGNPHDIWIELFTRAGWPPIFLAWFTSVLDCWTPLSYSFNPPKAMARTTLMDRDPKTLLAYPTRQAKDQSRVRPSQTSAMIAIMYCLGACGLAIYSL